MNSIFTFELLVSFSGIHEAVASLISGCSTVGSALDLGSRCRGFESSHSDQHRIRAKIFLVRTSKKGVLQMQTSDYLKKTGEELQSYLEFRRRGFKVRPKKGKGSFKRKEKHKEKFDA